MSAFYFCKNENRHAAVAAHLTLNGIDYLEVLDLEAPSGSPRQQTLLVRCLKSLPSNIAAEHVQITGGVPIYLPTGSSMPTSGTFSSPSRSPTSFSSSARRQPGTFPPTPFAWSTRRKVLTLSCLVWIFPSRWSAQAILTASPKPFAPPKKSMNR